MQYFVNAAGVAVAQDGAGVWRRFNTTTGRLSSFAAAPAPNAQVRTWTPPTPTANQQAAPQPAPATAPMQSQRQQAQPWTPWQTTLAVIICVAALILFAVVVDSITRNPLQTAYTPSPVVTQPVPKPVAKKYDRSPFIVAAPPGHRFVGATRGRDGDNCEDRGGAIVPDTSKPMVLTERGWARPNRCTAD